MTGRLRAAWLALSRPVIWDDADELTEAATIGTVVMDGEGRVWVFESVDLWLRTDSEEWWPMPNRGPFRVLEWGLG